MKQIQSLGIEIKDTVSICFLVRLKLMDNELKKFEFNLPTRRKSRNQFTYRYANYIPITDFEMVWFSVYFREVF